MANQIRIPAIPVSKPAEESGGGIGGILGAIVGGAAAIAFPPAAGLTVAGVAGGLGAGSGLGQLAGGVIAPGKAGQAGSIQVPEQQADDSSMKRRLQELNQPLSEQSQILAQGLKALQNAPAPVQKEYTAPLLQGFYLSHSGQTGGRIA